MPRPGPRKLMIAVRMMSEEVDDVDRRVMEENAALSIKLGIPVEELSEKDLVTRSSKLRDWIAAGRAAEDRKVARRTAREEVLVG